MGIIVVVVVHMDCMQVVVHTVVVDIAAVVVHMPSVVAHILVVGHIPVGVVGYIPYWVDLVDYILPVELDMR
jgi:hypothetical protein